MGDQKGKAKQDRELGAIGAIVEALDGLDGESIRRVLDYVFSRLSISSPSHMKTFALSNVSPSIQPIDVPHHGTAADGPHRVSSIRDLKEEKQPESVNQMAALVAYYVSEILPDPERKTTIATADLEKYFKQAGFRLPKSLPQTLIHATSAGYFDAVGNGMYKLNPVGYNLVVHGLPRSQAKNIMKIKKRISRASNQRKRKS